MTSQTIVHSRRSSVRSALFTPVALFLFFGALSADLSAQQLGTVITYQQSITSDEDDGRLFPPTYVYEDPLKEEIYVVDTKQRILAFTSDLFPLYTLNRKNLIYAPLGLTIGSDGSLYVAQAASKENPRNRITVLDPCLQHDREIYLEGMNDAASFKPYRLAADRKGNLYVTSEHFPGVLVLDSNDRIIDIMSPEENGHKAKMDNLTIDKDGKIYLLSQVEGRIYVYDSDRRFLFKFGERGGSTGKLSRPKAVAVDNRNGRMYVVDYMRHTITTYDNKGAFIFEFGGLGFGQGWFQYPVDIFIDRAGRIFVADFFNARVEVFKIWEQGGEESITGKPILISKEIPQ